MNHLSGPNIPAELETLYALRAERPELFALMVRMAKKFIDKGRDYSGKGMPSLSGNLLASEEIGYPAYVGIWMRLADKWARLKNFMRCGVLSVDEESIEDTMIDHSNYNLLWILAYRRAKAETHTTPPAPEPHWQQGRNDAPPSPAFDPKDVATWPLKEVPSALCFEMENPGRRGAR